MGVKAAGVGHFMIPTAPAIGTVVAQNASANTYTATYVQLIASTGAALYITGVYVQLSAGANLPTYMSVQLATGGAGSETIVDQATMNFGPTSGVASTAWGLYKPIYPPIPVANATRIAAKTASSVASALSWAVTLECIAQSNVVDDGIAVGTVTTLTNLPAIPSNWLTAAGIAAAALNGKGDWNLGKTGYTLTQGFPANFASASIDASGRVDVGKVLGTAQTARDLGAQLDAAISSRMASYTQPTGFLTAVFPSTIASPTNITAGTITTTTTLTNLPAVTTNWLTAAGIAAGALNGKGDWNIGKTGYALSTAGVQAVWDVLTSALTTASSIGKLLVDMLNAAIGSRMATFTYTVPDNASVIAIKTVTDQLPNGGALTNLDAAVSSRLAGATYAASDNASIAAIKAKTDALPASPADETLLIAATNSILSNVASVKSDTSAIKGKTDQLIFTKPNELNANLKSVNGVTVIGTGQSGSEWGPG